MNSVRDPRFDALFRRLPSPVQEAARQAYRQFQADPWRPSLRFKRVHPTAPIWSVRIGLHYRALGVREGDTLSWFWIGTHADYDAMVDRLGRA